MNFANNNENCIEFLNNQHQITVSFCMQKWINKVKKLKEEHPDDVKYLRRMKMVLFAQDCQLSI